MNIDFDTIQHENGLSDDIITILKCPETIDDIIRAGYATVSHFSRYDGAHNWPTPLHGTTLQDWGECVWCGTTRFDVRYGYAPYRCTKRPKDINKSIVEIVRGETERFERLLARGKVEIPKLIDRMGVSGETLAYIHQTHGYDYETIEGICGPFALCMREEYERAYEGHVALSRAAQKKEVIVAKTLSLGAER